MTEVCGASVISVTLLSVLVDVPSYVLDTSPILMFSLRGVILPAFVTVPAFAVSVLFAPEPKTVLMTLLPSAYCPVSWAV